MYSSLREQRISDKTGLRAWRNQAEVSFLSVNFILAIQPTLISSASILAWDSEVRVKTVLPYQFLSLKRKGVIGISEKLRVEVPPDLKL